MQVRSFKLRMALLSVLLSGVVLVGFGCAFLYFLHHVGLERVDRELRALGDSQLRSNRPWDMGAEFERTLGLVYGEREQDRIIFKAYQAGEQPVFVSPHWPKALTDDLLHLPEPARRRPPPPRPPPHPGSFPPPPAPRPHEPSMRPPQLQTISLANADWRVVILAHDHATIVVGMNLDAFYAEQARFLRALLAALPIALLLLGAAGWYLAGRALRPVRAITRTAQRVTAKGLDERIPMVRSDVEFAELVAVINRMLERLERSFKQAARFSADAAHELKTPLTILQGQLELALQEAADDSQAQRSYGELLEEVQRLRAIVRKLLLLSQADAGQMRLAREPLELSPLVEAICEDTRLSAPDLDVRAELDHRVRVDADRDLLVQVLHNLASNAVKYNEPGGAILFRVAAEQDRAVCTVASTGTALPDGERERIFERFYRGDPSRGRRVEGVGLGLSLAREIVLAHQGDLSVADGTPGWNTFRMTLPRRA